MKNEEKAFLMILKDIIHPKKEVSVLPDIDCEVVFDIAKKQNLFSLICDASASYPSFKEFNEANPQLLSITAASVISQMQKTAMFIDLYREFNKNGLYPITVKGVVCRSLYGDKADFRPSGDEDIIIEKDDYNKAVEILKANGYYSADRPDEKLNAVQEITFCSSFEDGRQNLIIELHLNPFGTDAQIRNKMNGWFNNIFKTAETVVIQDTAIRTLTPTAHFLFLAFHAFKHFTGGGFGIRLMLDLLLFAEKYGGSIKWNYIKRGLDDVGARGFFNDLLSIGNAYLGFDFPQKYKTVCPENLLADMFDMGTFGNSTKEARTAGTITTNMIRDNKEYKHNPANKAAAYFHLIFPSWNGWLMRKPYLADKPFMLPVEWVKRFCRYTFGKSSKNMNEIDEGYRISEHRLELLKKYGVV